MIFYIFQVFHVILLYFVLQFFVHNNLSILPTTYNNAAGLRQNRRLTFPFFRAISIPRAERQKKKGEREMPISDEKREGQENYAVAMAIIKEMKAKGNINKEEILSVEAKCTPFLQVGYICLELELYFNKKARRSVLFSFSYSDGVEQRNSSEYAP